MECYLQKNIPKKVHTNFIDIKSISAREAKL